MAWVGLGLGLSPIRVRVRVRAGAEPHPIRDTMHRRQRHNTREEEGAEAIMREMSMEVHGSHLTGQRIRGVMK